MCRTHAALTRLKQDEKGAAALDYGLTAALIAVVLILAASLAGGSLGATFGGLASSFSSIASGTALSSNGQAAPAAGTSACERQQAFLQASSSGTCQPSSSPAVTPAATVRY